MFKKSTSVEDRFDLNTPNRPETGCWEWAGSKQKGGYGQLEKVVDGRRVVYLAHRLAHALHLGPIPEGYDVEHVCENKACVRWTYDPALGSVHIQAVTHRDNMKRSSHRIGWGEYQRRRMARKAGQE